jgi:imidazolonepropionase-like amidohydrolase
MDASQTHDSPARRAASAVTAPALAVRAPLGWLGPGRLVEHVSVVVEGDRIVYAGESQSAPSTEITVPLDGVLLPAVADRHVHIALADPGAVLLGGVTAVRDLAWPADEIFPLADASEGPSFNGPLVRAAGPMITAPGGYPTRSEWAPAGTGLEVRGPEEAVRAIRDLAARGAAQIKVSLNADAGPTPTDDELVAVAQTAHEMDLLVTAHVQGSGQAERALGAGIDEIAHTPWTERLSDELVEALAKSTRIVSTLDIHSYGVDTPELRTAEDNLWRFALAGGKVLYGTDLGNGPVPPGIDIREVIMLFDMGMGAEAILEAMMRSPLEPGAPADLIGVARNPFEDIDALRDLRMVMRAGRTVLQR